MKRLAILDYTRFFAALMVVFYHYSFNGIANGKISSLSHHESLIEVTRYGYLGVELFFMISGYVIFFSAQSRSAAQFAVSRAVRLYPAYWFAVILTSSIAMFFGGELMSVQLSQVVWNMTMLQSFVWVPHVDGVYWTLVYEVTFYFAIVILLLLGLQQYLKHIFLLWPFIIAAATLLQLDSYPFLGEYYCYFSAGALFAMLKKDNSPRIWLALLLAWALCLEFSAGMAPSLSEHKGVHFSPWVIAVVVSGFFIVFLLQNTPALQQLELPGSQLAGALTYPLYLIHAHLGYMMLSLFATEHNKWLLYFAVLSLMLLLSYVIHSFLEEKFKSYWHYLFERTIGFALNIAEAGINNLISRLQVRQGKQP